MAHELTHVVQQSRSSSEEPGGNSANAESRASHAAAEVARGGFVSSNAIGQARLGIYADDGKETGVPPSGSSESPSLKLPGPPLAGPLKISSWSVQELIKQGLLSPQMLQLIQSGRIEIAQEKKAPSQTGGGTGNFASEFNALSSRFLGSGGLASRGEPATTPPAPSAPQSITVGATPIQCLATSRPTSSLGSLRPRAHRSPPGSPTGCSKRWRTSRLASVFPRALPSAASLSLISKRASSSPVLLNSFSRRAVAWLVRRN
jgi:hypothetical protein